jgi:cell division septation protein DedD
MTAAGSLKGGRARLGRVPAISLLLALLLATLLATPLWAAPAGPPGLTVERCGAFAQEPGPGDPWPGAKAVRLGEMVSPADRGFGCRFNLGGEAGAGPVAVQVRLSRPLAEGGLAEDRWFVPARPGDAAVASYALVPGQPVVAGDWTLHLEAPGTPAVEIRFQVAGRLGQTAAPAPAQDQVAATPSPLAPSAALPVAEPGASAAMPPAEPSATSPPAPAAAPPAPSPVARPAGPSAASPAAPVPPARPAKDKPTAPQSPPAAPAAGYVALQTGLFADPDNAAAQAARLRTRGLPACVAATETGRGRRYRVLAGRFGDRSAAAAARGEVAALLGLTPIVTAVTAADVPRLRCR